MMEIWLPLTPIIIFYLFISLYNRKRKHRTIWKGRVFDNFIIIFILSLGFFAGIAHILDPNSYARGIGSGNFSYLYTTARIMGWWVLALMYTGIHHRFMKKENLICCEKSKLEDELDLQWTGYKVIFVLMCFTAILSGGYGFLTRTCWGLFESRYIQDSFMWWAELGWCIAGIIGLFCYFKYIRYWDGKEEETV